MNLGLKGRVAAVAAASKGLGRACAEAFAREGADVAICARGTDALEATAKELRALGVRVHAVALDLIEPDEAERFVEETVAALGSVDVLVANAGGPAIGSLESFELQEYRRAVELNLLTTVRLARAAVPHMRARGWGRIINITSQTVKQPVPGLGLSSMARAGVVGFAKSLADELASTGITVNTVAPGPFLTDRILELAEATAAKHGLTVEDALAAQAASVPVGRMGRPEELGALVAFLAGEHAGYITGAVIQVDGGVIRSLL